MGLPLPIFYFNQDKYGRLIVVDGRQRLTALFEYMNDMYTLTKLKILPKLNNLRFSQLPPQLVGRLEDYQIQAHVILPPTPERIKFDIFDRVNRGGMQLNKQEIRNALYQGEATKLLKRIVESDTFMKATGGAFINEKRMKDKYLITRFITFVLYYLNKLEDDAFRLKQEGKRSPINMNVFETVMFMMIPLPKNSTSLKSKVQEEYFEFINSPQFRDNIGNHRDSATKLHWRLETAKKIGKKIVDGI